jgi:hypothetical protein
MSQSPIEGLLVAPPNEPTQLNRLERRKTLFYNAKKYESFVARKTTFTVVLLGTEYVKAKKMGAKDYTV